MSETVLVCRLCGWISDPIKKHGKLNLELLKFARKQAKSHMGYVHGGIPDGPNIYIERLPTSRAKQIRNVKK